MLDAKLLNMLNTTRQAIQKLLVLNFIGAMEVPEGAGFVAMEAAGAAVEGFG